MQFQPSPSTSRRLSGEFFVQPETKNSSTEKTLNKITEFNTLYLEKMDQEIDMEREQLGAAALAKFKKLQSKKYDKFTSLFLLTAGLVTFTVGNIASKYMTY